MLAGTCSTARITYVCLLTHSLHKIFCSDMGSFLILLNVYRLWFLDTSAKLSHVKSTFRDSLSLSPCIDFRKIILIFFIIINILIFIYLTVYNSESGQVCGNVE